MEKCLFSFRKAQIEHSLGIRAQFFQRHDHILDLISDIRNVPHVDFHPVVIAQGDLVRIRHVNEADLILNARVAQLLKGLCGDGAQIRVGIHRLISCVRQVQNRSLNQRICNYLVIIHCFQKFSVLVYEPSCPEFRFRGGHRLTFHQFEPNRSGQDLGHYHLLHIGQLHQNAAGRSGFVDAHQHVAQGHAAGVRDLLLGVTDVSGDLDLIHPEKQAAEARAARAKAAEAARLTFDLSGLDAIRASSARTMDRLIVEEELEASAPPPPEPAAPEPQEASGPLDATETAFVRALLEGQPYQELLSSKGIILSVLVDHINEALYDLLADTAIEWDGDRPVLVEDYIEDLKGLIQS